MIDLSDLTTEQLRKLYEAGYLSDYGKDMYIDRLREESKVKV